MVFKKLLMLTAIITGFSFISDDCNCMSRNNNNRINVNSRNNQHSNSNNSSRNSNNNSDSDSNNDLDAAPKPGEDYDDNSDNYDEYIDGDLEAPMSIVNFEKKKRGFRNFYKDKNNNIGNNDY